LHAQTAGGIGRIGEILQKIHNLDHTLITLKNHSSGGGGHKTIKEQTLFYSD